MGDADGFAGPPQTLHTRTATAVETRQVASDDSATSAILTIAVALLFLLFRPPLTSSARTAHRPTSIGDNGGRRAGRTSGNNTHKDARDNKRQRYRGEESYLVLLCQSGDGVAFRPSIAHGGGGMGQASEITRSKRYDRL